MIRSLHASFAIGSLGLAHFIAACGTSDPDPQGGGQAGSATGVSGSATGVSGSATGVSGSATGVSGGGPLPTGGSNGTAGGAATAGTTGAGGGNGDAGGPPTTGGGGTVPTVNLPEGVVTSSNGAFWKTGTLTPSTSGTVDVTANDTSAKQRWDGFGGTFNEAGWDALGVLTEAERLQALKLLFDAADGANFAYGRLPIGASDYSMKRYTLAETANDYTMSSFSLEQDKKMLIPYIKAALAIKPDVHLWASPWTPPAWMKSNNSTDAGNMKDDAQVLTAFALYLEKFVQGYAAEGLKIEAVHPQNEPGYTNPYPSCGWSSALYIKFIRDYLGPLFEKDNVPAEIWCGTMSNETDGTIATSLANDAKAMSYVKGFGLQWNTRSVVGTLKSKGAVMQTEHKCGNYDFQTENATSTYDPNKPQNDYAYGVESWKNIKVWIDAGVNSYSAWNMVLDTLGTNLNASKPWHQNALLVVDRGAKKLTATPAYYVFRHLSQYVSPKATVIGTTGGDALAFKNPDGKLVVVMYNSGGAKTATVSLGGTKFSFDMPGNGWATVYHSK